LKIEAIVCEDHRFCYYIKNCHHKIIRRMKSICNFIARWMGAMVLLAAVVAMVIPEPFMQVGTWTINPMLGLIMFGMGLTLSPNDFRIVFSRPKDVLMGCLAQFTIMPFMAWLLTKAFSLPEELALGVILVGCCPGGTASNVITYLAKGDLALSVGMTATSTVLAPMLTPLLTWLMAGTFVEVDTWGMLLSIVYVVIAPIVVGFLIQHFLPRLTQKAVAYLPAFSSIAIAITVAIVVGHNASKLLTGGLLVMGVVVLHNLSGLALGYGLGRLLGLNHEKRTAISIEVGMQNSGLASSLATLHFTAFPMAAIPGAIFSVWHNISGALVAKIYANTRKRTI
jgi:BASS family bile acid:Na+ symporter